MPITFKDLIPFGEVKGSEKSLVSENHINSRILVFMNILLPLMATSLFWSLIFSFNVDPYVIETCVNSQSPVKERIVMSPPSFSRMSYDLRSIFSGITKDHVRTLNVIFAGILCECLLFDTFHMFFDRNFRQTDEICIGLMNIKRKSGRFAGMSTMQGKLSCLTSNIFYSSVLAFVVITVHFELNGFTCSSPFIQFIQPGIGTRYSVPDALYYQNLILAFLCVFLLIPTFAIKFRANHEYVTFVYSMILGKEIEKFLGELKTSIRSQTSQDSSKAVLNPIIGAVTEIIGMSNPTKTHSQMRTYFLKSNTNTGMKMFFASVGVNSYGTSLFTKTKEDRKGLASDRTHGPLRKVCTTCISTINAMSFKNQIGACIPEICLITQRETDKPNTGLAACPLTSTERSNHNNRVSETIGTAKSDESIDKIIEQSPITVFASIVNDNLKNVCIPGSYCNFSKYEDLSLSLFIAVCFALTKEISDTMVNHIGNSTSTNIAVLKLGNYIVDGTVLQVSNLTELAGSQMVLAAKTMQFIPSTKEMRIMEPEDALSLLSIVESTDSKASKILWNQKLIMVRTKSKYISQSNNNLRAVMLAHLFGCGAFCSVSSRERIMEAYDKVLMDQLGKDCFKSECSESDVEVDVIRLCQVSFADGVKAPEVLGFQGLKVTLESRPLLTEISQPLIINKKEEDASDDAEELEED